MKRRIVKNEDYLKCAVVKFKDRYGTTHRVTASIDNLRRLAHAILRTVPKGSKRRIR